MEIFFISQCTFWSIQAVTERNQQGKLEILIEERRGSLLEKKLFRLQNLVKENTEVKIFNLKRFKYE